MSTSLTPITNANTFGQWKEKTNDIITALGNTVTLGDAETNDGNVVLTGSGDITSQGTLYINTIDATAANSANIITINADAKLNGELQINNTYASEINYYQSGILTWTAGTNATHTQFDIKKGNAVLRVDETAGAITGSGLIIDDSLLPDLITSNITGNVTGDITGDVDGNVTGRLLATNSERSHGAYGAYATTRIGHVWSMGTAYKIPDDGLTFGNLHGIAYYHPDNITALLSPTYTAAQQLMASGNQIVFTNNGVPGVSIGLNGGNIWAKGNIYENETLLSTTYLGRAGGSMSGALTTTKSITLTGTGADGTVTAAKFAGPLTGAVTGDVTGDVDGDAATATKWLKPVTVRFGEASGTAIGDVTGSFVIQGGNHGTTTATLSVADVLGVDLTVRNDSHIHTSSTIADLANATNSSTANTLVKRDASKNFAANVITATTFSGALSGKASTATKLATGRYIDITGDITAAAVLFDGSSNIAITASVNNNSHSHTSANISDATSANTVSTIVERNSSGGFSAGTITATKFSGPLTGDVTGKASTATKLATGRTIDITGDITAEAVTFDGSSNISISASVNDDSHAHKYSNLTSIPTSFPPSSHTHVSADITDATSANTASTIVERNSSGGFSAGTISAALSGNASTATKLATSRTIDITGDITATAQSFDGSANIAISASVNDNSHSHTSANISDATSANTGSTIVERNSSGGFSAGTISATLSGTHNGNLVPSSGTNRSQGAYGVYDSYKIAHIWGMGTGFKIPNDGSNFGTLYGMAYKHVNNLTGSTMAGGHQIVFSSNGTPGAAIGLGGNIWTTGTIYENSKALDTLYADIGHNHTGTYALAAHNHSYLSSSGGTLGGNLLVSGYISSTGNITAYGTTSDIRIKENVVKIDNALDKVNQISGYTFNYIGDDNSMTGVIAQEIEKVLPQVVYETEELQPDGTPTKAVRYGNIVGLLIEAIKDLKAEVDELKKAR